MAGSTETTLAAVMRPITSIHESMTADRMLRHLRERRSHHALVVDEFGGTAGLLTLEDVLSELIGNVGDEFKPGDPIAETLPDGRVRLPGSMTVDDAAVLLETAWDSDAATVGGLVTEALGHLPDAWRSGRDRRLRVRGRARRRPGASVGPRPRGTASPAEDSAP